MQNDPYRRVANWYDTLFQPMNAALLSIGLKLFPPAAGMKVLDVGCGTGAQLARYQKIGCEVYGIDLSPSMLAMAQKRLGELVDLHLGSATELPFEDNYFDLVTATLVLHELDPTMRDAVLTEMGRVMKKNGRLLLIDFHPGSLRFPKGYATKAFITLSEILAGRDHFRHYRQFMAKKGLPALVAQHGLTVDQQKIVSGGNMALFLLSNPSSP